MARVLITGILALFLLQLAAGQSTSACLDALNTLAANTASCTPTVNDPQIFCTGQCRGFYDAVIQNCDETSAAATQQALDTTCQESPGPSTDSTGPSTACQDALNTLSINLASCTPTQNNPQIFCTGECRGFYDDVIDNCDETSAMVTQQALDTCPETTEGDGDSTGGDSTGGDSTGGDSTGGDSTGGDSTGGDSTGGDSTGGDSTGGDSTGGDSNEGDSNEGDSNEGDSNGGVSISKGLGVFSLLLISVIAAVAF